MHKGYVFTSLCMVLDLVNWIVTLLLVLSPMGSLKVSTFNAVCDSLF